MSYSLENTVQLDLTPKEIQNVIKALSEAMDERERLCRNSSTSQGGPTTYGD